MIQEDFAAAFANDWIQAWNSHDLDKIMEHYSDAIVFKSPVIAQVNNDPTGTITDKALLRQYFERALGIYPDLHFELYKTLVSVNSIVLYYKTIKDMTTAEYMELDEQGKVVRVCAHYAQ